MSARRPIPEPPDPRLVWLTLDQAAGHLQVPRCAVDERRRKDARFAAIVHAVGGVTRVRRSDLDRWVETQPSWTGRGGRRERRVA
jgi:hypothetical protein